MTLLFCDLNTGFLLWRTVTLFSFLHSIYAIQPCYWQKISTPKFWEPLAQKQSNSYEHITQNMFFNCLTMYWRAIDASLTFHRQTTSEMKILEGVDSENTRTYCLTPKTREIGCISIRYVKSLVALLDNVDFMVPFHATISFLVGWAKKCSIQSTQTIISFLFEMIFQNGQKI